MTVLRFTLHHPQMPNNPNKAPATVGEVSLRIFADMQRDGVPFDLDSSVIRHVTALVEQLRLKPEKPVRDPMEEHWNQGYNQAVQDLNSKIDDMLK